MAEIRVGQPVNRRLGDLLVDDGLITQEHLQRRAGVVLRLKGAGQLELPRAFGLEPASSRGMHSMRSRHWD